MDNEKKIRLAIEKEMTIEELIRHLEKEDPATSIIDAKVIEDSEDSIPNNENDSSNSIYPRCFDASPMGPITVNTFHHADIMARVYGSDYGYGISNIIQKECDGGATAATDDSQRGVVEHMPEGFENALPNPIKNNVFIERSNNTEIVNALMSIDEQAIKAKANIDLIANRKKYETLLEYNTVCGMHQSSALMCRIVEDFEPRKDEDE